MSAFRLSYNGERFTNFSDCPVIRAGIMWEAFRWWRSLKRNKTLREWMQEAYSLNEIRRLAVEPTDCDLHETWTPWNDGDLGLEQWETEEKDKEKATARLYRKYGKEIWLMCLPSADRVGPHGETYVKTGLRNLAGLDLGNQVSNPKQFEEFMVRNALRITAAEI